MPRYSQRFDRREWEEGAPDAPEGPDHWSDRACGIACLQMVLDHFHLPVPPMTHLLDQGLQMGAYSPRGWIHAGLAELGRCHGLDSEAATVPDLDALEALLRSGRPVIASVSLRLPLDGRRGGHLIVVCGRPASPRPSVTFRDPSGWGAGISEVADERFRASFTGRVIWAARSDTPEPSRAARRG